MSELVATVSRRDPSVKRSAGSSEPALDLVRLRPLMARTSGSPAVRIGLIDGPVSLDHPHFAKANVLAVADSRRACRVGGSEACRHGTLVAGVLVSEKGSGAPAICPRCTLLIRPIFFEEEPATTQLPAASMDEVALAIVETIDAGAHILNLSVALTEPSSQAERRMHEALDYAARRGVIVVAAAGNRATLGSSVITRHPWVVPVTACDLHGRPMADTTLSHSAGKRGVAAPGIGVVSLSPGPTMQPLAGTSAATPFVTGAFALLKSLVPSANGGQLRSAVTRSGVRRGTVVPPLLDGVGAVRLLSQPMAKIGI